MQYSLKTVRYPSGRASIISISMSIGTDAVSSSMDSSGMSFSSLSTSSSCRASFLRLFAESKARLIVTRAIHEYNEPERVHRKLLMTRNILMNESCIMSSASEGSAA